MAWSLLIIAAIAVTCATRLISYHFGIPASAYLILVPMFAGTLLSARQFTWRRVDQAVVALIAIPIVWFPISGMIATNSLQPFPWHQFYFQLSISVTTYIGYFAVRYAPIERPTTVFWIFLAVTGLAVPVLYLQQAGVLDQFYPVTETRIGSTFSDPTTGFARFRNMGFFGNWHDAGSAVLLEFLGIYACFIQCRTMMWRVILGVALLATLGALFLTSSRAELMMAGITLVTWKLFMEPYFRGSIHGLFQNLRVFIAGGVIAGTATWYAFVKWPEILQATILVSSGFAFIQNEGRLADTLNALYFLASDPIRALFGWGMGSGGIPVAGGRPVVPVNTVDFSLTIGLANYGILGYSLYVSLLGYIFICMVSVHACIKALATKALVTRNLQIMSEFCVIAMWCTFLALIPAGLIDNRVYANLLFLCVGATMNAYDRILSRAEDEKQAGAEHELFRNRVSSVS